MKQAKPFSSKLQLTDKSVLAYILETYGSTASAFSYYREYFDIPVAHKHFRSIPEMNAVGKNRFRLVTEYALVNGGREPIRVDRVAADQIITGLLGNVSITDGLLGKHFLSATGEVNPAIAVWCHLCSKQESRWLIVDRDHKDSSDTRSILEKYEADIAIVTKILGLPNLVVTSRSGNGFHFYYLLDDYYDIQIIQAFSKKVFDAAGVTLKNGTWEVFPKDTKSAMTPLPFGMNSYIIQAGVKLDVLGIKALLHWFNNSKPTAVLKIDTEAIVLPETISTPTITAGADLQRPLIDSPELDFKDLSREVKEEYVVDLFANPHNYSRREAQKILKFHYLESSQLRMHDAVKTAWDWMCANIRSKDIKRDPAGALKDLQEFFKNPLITDIQYSYRNHISYYEAQELLKRLIAVHAEIKSYDQTSGQRKSYFVLAVYSAYFFLYYQMISRNLKNGYFTAKAVEMRYWKACSEQRYVKAVEILIKLGLVKQVKSVSHWDNDADFGFGGFRNECYQYKVASLPLESIPNDKDKTETFRLNEASFIRFIVQRVPKEIGADLFGVKGYVSRQKELVRFFRGQQSVN